MTGRTTSRIDAMSTLPQSTLPQSTLPQSTLAHRIRSACGWGIITFVGAGDPQPVPWAQLHEDALAMAAELQRRGVAPGVHVAVLGVTSRPLVTAIQATWLAGGVVVVLPLPMRLGSLEEFLAHTRARVVSADAGLLVVDDAFAALVEPAPGDPPFVRLDELWAAAQRARRARRSEQAYLEACADPHSLAILQFTSGSTADPKGVMLPHAQVTANLDAIAAAAQVDIESDVLVSWLPLYHDMGLIGLLTLAMTTGVDLVLAAPQDFLSSPGRWMQWMSEFGGTATAGPNFAYALAARALRRMEGLDLSRWRLGLNGAEPVDPTSVEEFCAAGAPHRLDPRSVFCAFGMAEATLAVTFPVPSTGMSVDTVDAAVLEADRYAAPTDPSSRRARRLARLGSAVPGLEIRIVDPTTGSVLAEREVGELQIRGTSVTPGYYRYPRATAELFSDGWLRTGDLGYLVGGELVACGRSKDMIIVGGRNLFPEDIERAVGEVEGVRTGNVIAFGVEGRKGREAVVVVAESKAHDVPSIRQAVALRVRSAVGLPPEEVVIVPPGTLPKTSSGKLQRSLCRNRYLAAALQPLQPLPAL